MRILRKPEPETIFGNLSSDEIVRQAEHAGEKKSADLCRSLTHAALEGRIFLNHKNAECRVASLQKKCG